MWTATAPVGRVTRSEFAHDSGGSDAATGRSGDRGGAEGAGGARGRADDDPPDDDHFGGPLFR